MNTKIEKKKKCQSGLLCFLFPFLACSGTGGKSAWLWFTPSVSSELSFSSANSSLTILFPIKRAWKKAVRFRSAFLSYNLIRYSILTSVLDSLDTPPLELDLMDISSMPWTKFPPLLLETDRHLPPEWLQVSLPNQRLLLFLIYAPPPPLLWLPNLGEDRCPPSKLFLNNSNNFLLAVLLSSFSFVLVTNRKLSSSVSQCII